MNRERPHPTTVGGLGLRPLLTVGVVALSATGLALCLPPWIAAILAAAMLLLLLLPPLRLRWGILVTAAVFLLSAAAQRSVYELPLQALVGHNDTITARVVETPRKGQTYTVEVLSAHHLPKGTRLTLYCLPESAPQRYDTVAADVILSTAADSRYGDRVFLHAFPVGGWDASAEVIADGEPSGLYAVRLYFDRILRRTLPQEEGDLLAALCLGQRDTLSPTIDDAFRQSGLSHLLVVSGLHLSMIAVALRALLRRIGVGYRTAAALTIPLVWSFAGMVGSGPSVLRAAVMGTVWLVGFLVYRRHNGLNAWGLAAAVLLLADPYRLSHIGFQLSFAATAGVLCIAPRLCHYPTGSAAKRPLARLWDGVRLYVRNGLAVCAGATLFTLPFTVFHFRGFSLTSPVANLLTVVPAGWALTVGWLGLLCGAVPFLGWLSQPLLHGAGWLMRWVHGVATLCGPQETYVYTPHSWQMVLITALCAAIACGILLRVSWRRVAVLTAIAAVAISSISIPLYRPTPRLTILGRGAYTALLLQDGDRAAVMVDHNAALRNIDYELRQRGVTRLDYLLIQEGTPAHSGGLRRVWEVFGQPAVYTADPDPWYAGADMAVLPIPSNPTLSLNDSAITPIGEGWWRWRGALICTDPTQPRPETAALSVYTALPDEIPDEGRCVIAHYRGAPPTIPLSDTTLLVTQEDLTLTVREDGEWSELPWP